MNPKFLIIAPAWVGDLVIAQALIRQLKLTNPDTVIDVLAPAWCQDLIKRMPEVRKILNQPLRHKQFNLKARWKMGRALISENYDQSIVLPNSWKSALIPYFARIPKRTGFFGECRIGLLNDWRLLNKTRYPLLVQRYVALAFEKDVTWDGKNYPTPKLHSAIPSEPNTLVIAPGAAHGDTKRWPAKQYAMLANLLLSQGWKVMALGSADDLPTLQEIEKYTEKKITSFAGETPLDQKVDLIARATVVVSNDSGLMHIAAALERPVIGIFGSTSSKFTPPLGEKVRVVENKTLACRPCFQSVCPLKDKEHLLCLTSISVQEVMTALEALCKAPNTGSSSAKY